MPWSHQEHLDNLVRHIGLVRDACLLLGRRLMADGQPTFGRILIARGFKHDASKFEGVELEYLHAGPDVPAAELALARRDPARRWRSAALLWPLFTKG